jgi:hypothetical protein
MAPLRGVAEPLSDKLVCADLLRLVEDSAWLLKKNGYIGPSRTNHLPDYPYFSLNAQGEVSTTPSHLHLLQAKTRIEVGSDGAWISR